MEMALNMAAFEELSKNELFEVDGGSTKVAAAVCGIASGACFIVSGIATLCGKDKLAGIAGAAGGACGIAAGICAAIPAP